MASVSVTALSIAVSLTSSNVDRLGAGGSNVPKYNFWVTSLSVTVNNDNVNNRIRGVTAYIGINVPGTYVVTVSVNDNPSCSASTTASLPGTVTVTLPNVAACNYVSAGAPVRIEVRPP
ncbi:MAG: hypothetical protein NYU90_03130 [Aigarchaeota archaeon]|nr:hypothetical protein [Candidatus Calditenuis fumarioli]